MPRNKSLLRSMEALPSPGFEGIAAESALLRWSACELLPEIHESARTEKREWPEATVLSYLLQGVEDFALEALVEHIQTRPTKHLSLEFDGVGICAERMTEEPGLIQAAESTSSLKQDTGW